MLRIPTDTFSDILDQAREAAPVEACGLLAGIGSEVRQSYRLTNIDNSPEHFSLDTKEQFTVVRHARRLGLEVLAVYHSHPATPARMSDEDLRLALAPGFHYLIVSLMDSRPEVKSFMVVDGHPVEEQVIIQEQQQ